MNLESLTNLIAAQLKPEPEASGSVILAALQQQPHIYGGTVPYTTIQKRRAANRVARKSRATNTMTAMFTLFALVINVFAAVYNFVVYAEYGEGINLACGMLNVFCTLWMAYILAAEDY